MVKFLRSIFLLLILGGCGGGVAVSTAIAACPVSPATAMPIADVITTRDDLATNTLPAMHHFTSDLSVAREVLQCGKLPALWLGDVLFDRSTGLIVPDAWYVIGNLVSQYQDVFSLQGLKIEIIDEPFWNKTAPLQQQIDSINLAVAIVKTYAPLSSVGVVFAPVWETSPDMIQGALAIAQGLQWVAVDPYALSLQPSELQHTINLANDFGMFVAANYPGLERWLVLQGFGPIYEVAPIYYSQNQLDVFEGFLSSMASVAAQHYSGVAIWGWSNVNELPAQYAGKFFPENLKEFYASKMR